MNNIILLVLSAFFLAISLALLSISEKLEKIQIALEKSVELMEIKAKKEGLI